MASSRVRILLVLALTALLAGCGGSGEKTTTAPSESAAVKAAQQALLQSYGMAKDYAAAHAGFGDPQTLGPKIGASTGNPDKRDPGAIYVVAASAKHLELVTDALDGTVVTMIASGGADVIFETDGT